MSKHQTGFTSQHHTPFPGLSPGVRLQGPHSASLLSYTPLPLPATSHSQSGVSCPSLGEARFSASLFSQMLIHMQMFPHPPKGLAFGKQNWGETQLQAPCILLPVTTLPVAMSTNQRCISMEGKRGEIKRPETNISEVLSCHLSIKQNST